VSIYRLNESIGSEYQVEAPHVVGESAAMRALLKSVERVGPKDVTVLLRGETGTGKELIASLVHAQSARASAPLVRFNCAAVPASLAEAELFGHTRGAFTGADRPRAGFFSAADGGTLVLDEVGELPPQIQAKLLRVLQNGEIQQVGASRVGRVDVRVIACTNRDLAAETRMGGFRSDLYYRLAVVELVVPPLRERREEIPLLAAEFARRYGDRFGNGGVQLSPTLLEVLRQRDWAGNVRELENTIARLVALHGGAAEIGVDALMDTSVERSSAQARPTPTCSLREQIDAIEQTIIARTLAAVSGNRSEAARRLGVSRSSLGERLRKYRLALLALSPELATRPSGIEA
jgi:two-component system, NtrC family, response regulator AtoC